ncbi:bifunctional glycosyltransferase family 2/GtrA family protein [Streptomyces lavendulocolor]|uniref:bifunctional glycosyltransferase family 2/GtrA family protein n=1 Tax=Streptomyces lavendulocolor TaxID=67316 RepID=UPI0034085CCB
MSGIKGNSTSHEDIASIANDAIEIALPAYNEEEILEASVTRLHQYLTRKFPFSFQIVIVNNGSSDGTAQIAEILSARIPNVRALHLSGTGKGLAVRAAWSTSRAPVLAYMDVDLSTDLAALLPLVAPLLSGHSDIAIGSRLSRGSRVIRGTKREIISRAYNMLLRGTLLVKPPDAQCGFKAIRRSVAHELLPKVIDNGWFFDAELLYLAQRAGLRIHEVPVDWIDNPDSRVDIFEAICSDLRGIARLFWTSCSGAIKFPESLRAQRPPIVSRSPVYENSLAAQLLRFGMVGVISTLAHLLVYILLRSALAAYSANMLALLLATLGNTAANRRFTFKVAGRQHRIRQHAQAIVILCFASAVTSMALAALNKANASAPIGAEVSVLAVANLLATALRFTLLRHWVFKPPSPILKSHENCAQGSRWILPKVHG